MTIAEAKQRVADLGGLLPGESLADAIERLGIQ